MRQFTRVVPGAVEDEWITRASRRSTRSSTDSFRHSPSLTASRSYPRDCLRAGTGAGCYGETIPTYVLLWSVGVVCAKKGKKTVPFDVRPT